MKLRYLGTAAAEGTPALFCHCDVCQRASRAGGRNIRTRSQAAVDDVLLIDFPADTYLHVLQYGLDLKKIENCLVTHSHSDHLYVPDLQMRKEPFAHSAGEEGFPPLTFFASAKSGAGIAGLIEQHSLEEKCNMRFYPVEPFQPFFAGRYKVTALKADHAKELDPLIYIIGDGDKTMLYANDTGYFPDETWAWLEKTKPHFDFVSLDCTGAVFNYRRGHMGMDTGVEVRERLVKMGCGGEGTVWCYHHFSHNGLVTYDEFVPPAAEKGFLVSYDGMEIEF